jgi:hypothetical protein
MAGTAKRQSSAKRGITWVALCKLALKLPGVERGTSYGTPALHVRKKFLARLKEDGESVAIKVPFDDRDVLLELDPAGFYLTDHYRGYPAMLLRLATVRLDLLDKVIEGAWRMQAPPRLVASASEGPPVTPRAGRASDPSARPARRARKPPARP